MNTIIARAGERGFFNHGWLKTYHSFSFAQYFNPDKMGFGALRVLNDDTVMGGTGFGLHPHSDMEIVSIPIKGALLHQDNQGNEKTIHNNEVQVMSAGTGIYHSEHNASKAEDVNFLQIWILPKIKNIEPRYEQKSFSRDERKNKWQILVSPDQKTDALWLNQDAVLSRIELSKNMDIGYNAIFENSGIYLFVIEGDIIVENLRLSRRDGLEIIDSKKISIKSFMQSDILLIEVPMIQ